MFNPEFKYLLAQEADNAEEIQNTDIHIWAAILVCGLNFLILGTLFYISLKLLCIFGLYLKLICIYLWNTLTPRNQVLELLAIFTTILAIILMNYTFYKMDEHKNKRFIKLKEDIRATQGKGESPHAQMD